MCQPTKNKSIMNKIFLNNIGDLGEAQRASYYRFLSNGISEELSNFPNPFSSKVKVPTRASKRKVSCLVYIYPHEIKLKGPTSSMGGAQYDCKVLYHYKGTRKSLRAIN